MQAEYQLINKLLKDMKVQMDDEFDRNFERKAFFNTAWKPAIRNDIGSLLNRTGALRNSIRSRYTAKGIEWTSDLPYAHIQNYGGTITVTQKMKGFFWYRYRMATGGNNKNLNADALFWKAMALKPIGSKINIPKRQFIEYHPRLDQIQKEVGVEWFNTDVKNYMDNMLNNMVK